MSETPTRPPVAVDWLGRQAYAPVYQRMRARVAERIADRGAHDDAIWLLEHDPVFTQGRAGDPAHVLAAGDIPVVETNRGGQVTYHGPGQLMVYPLLDIQHRGLDVRQLVDGIEQAVIDALATFDIRAARRAGAPGVYVGDAKIASLGLRIERGLAYHGLAVNVAMDLEPFARINPCGYSGLVMTQTSAQGGPRSVPEMARVLLPLLAGILGLTLPPDWSRGLPASPD